MKLSELKKIVEQYEKDLQKNFPDPLDPDVLILVGDSDDNFEPIVKASVFGYCEDLHLYTNRRKGERRESDRRKNQDRRKE